MEAKLRSKKLTELKDMAREMHIRVSGNKDELIDRIISYNKGDEVPSYGSRNGTVKRPKKTKSKK